MSSCLIKVEAQEAEALNRAVVELEGAVCELDKYDNETEKAKTLRESARLLRRLGRRYAEKLFFNFLVYRGENDGESIVEAGVRGDDVSLAVEEAARDAGVMEIRAKLIYSKLLKKYALRALQGRKR